MRAFIKDSKAANQPTPQDGSKFFDSVSFWQQAYEKSEAEQSILLDRIYELESRNEVLSDKLRSQSGVASFELSIASEVGKRKGAPDSESTAGGARKRAKTQAVSITSSLGTGGAGDVEYLEESSYIHPLSCYMLNITATASFMRQFYTLQKTLQRRPNRSSIVRETVSLCNMAKDEILDAVSEKKAVSRPRTAVLQTRQLKLPAIIRAVDCAFQLLCQALRRLSGSAQGVHDTGQVTYHIVCLYDAVMTALQKHCQAMAQQNTNANSNSKSTKQRNATKLLRTKTSRNPGPSPSKPEGEVPTQIARLLGAMALSLDISLGEHQEILEGFLFILLARIGKLLCLFVFQDLQRRPDLYVDSTKIPLPEGLIGADSSETALLAAQMEAKHLIWLLERILALLDTSSSDSATLSETFDCRAKFVSKVKERLQSTLLQAVFGADQPFFHESLQRPLQPNLLPETLHDPQGSENPGIDWFVQEVWRLLGWEMLMETD